MKFYSSGRVAFNATIYCSQFCTKGGNLSLAARSHSGYGHQRNKTRIGVKRGQKQSGQLIKSKRNFQLDTTWLQPTKATSSIRLANKGMAIFPPFCSLKCMDFPITLFCFFVRNFAKHGRSTWEFLSDNVELVGGWATPLKNMKVNWDDYSQYMGK